MFVICTARPARWMRPLAEATGHRGVAICSNGGVLWDLHTESVLEDFPLDPGIAGEVVALLQEEFPGGVWAVERSSGVRPRARLLVAVADPAGDDRGRDRVAGRPSRRTS